MTRRRHSRTKILLWSCLLLGLLVDAYSNLDYYKVLGVSRTASTKDIRSSYRKMSKKFHPDKKGGDPSRFQEVSEAFEVLSDDEKRGVYDRHGHDGLRRLQQGGDGEPNNPFDLFSRFFGGGGGGKAQERKGPNMVSEVTVSLEDIYTGKTFDFEVSAKRICDHCSGSGANSPKDIHTCDQCDGRGIVVVRHQLAPGMFTQMQQHCSRCGGQGKMIKKICPVCKAQRVVQQSNTLSLSIDRGLPDDSEIVFEGESDESPDFVAGDVIVRVKSLIEEGGFSRKGSHLFYKQVITVDEALLGFKKRIASLDGHFLELKRTGITQPGEVETIKDEGMPHYHGSGFGNLYVTYQIVLPQDLTANMRTNLELAFGRKAGHEEL